jgi:DNA-binding XRE family transcriptional regulator
VLAAVPVEGDTPSQAPPGDADIVQGLGCTPFHEGLPADREQLVTTALPFLAHDSHTGLVGDAGADVSFASAAAARDGLYALDFVADSGVKNGVGQEDQSVRAGVRVVIVINFGRAEYAKLIHVNSSDLLAGLRGVTSTCGAIFLSTATLSHITVENAIAKRDNPLMILSRLKERRLRRGLTQIELAKLSDVGRATIAAIETDKRKRVHPATRRRLARALKVKPEELA